MKHCKEGSRVLERFWRGAGGTLLWQLAACLCLGGFVAETSSAQSTPVPAASVVDTAWKSVGPDGGDARSLAADPRDPQHLYLGTTSSWIYETTDGGRHWQRLVKLGSADDLIVDSIAVDRGDPKTLVSGVWKVDGRGGGIYLSHDGGKNWAAVPDMAGQNVMALAEAPSDPKMFTAGTLSGVYLSADGGQHWKQISPAGSTELHEVESVAIDPVDTNTVYAGTWHLPWKTTDGGAHWTNIKEGLIDDSDVFSIIIDPHAPSVVFASACSGIYKSDNAGSLFHKVQGIPSTARRTRVLMQDPVDSKVVYAGTTEGLYKTDDGGAKWARLTGPDVIINDVFVDPADHARLLLATDRSGVLLSTDGGKTFSSTNAGFSQRVVQTLLVDATRPGTLYAGVLNDKIYGGVFRSTDDGATWQQQADGLAGRDVFVLAQGGDGTILAGTSDGIAKLSNGTWQAAGDILTRETRKVAVREHGRRATRSVDTVAKTGAMTGRVNSLDLSGPVWYATTSKGVFRSMDHGGGWEMAATLPPNDYRYVRARGSQVVAGFRASLFLSEDAGVTWKPLAFPGDIPGVNALALSEDGVIWIGGRGGVLYTKDGGASWQSIKNLPLGEIDGLDYNPALKRVLVSSRTSTTIFGVDASGEGWKFWQAGWRVHQVLQQGARLAAASLYDGVVLQTPPAVATTGPAPGLR